MKRAVKIITSLGLIATTATLVACGSGGGSNDQGVSFSALGFYGTNDDGVCDPEIGSSGIIVPISGFGSDTFDAQTTGSAFTCIGVQNNMTTQSVRTQRINLDYYIEGAADNPPSTQVAFGKVIGRVPVSTDSGSGDGSDALVVGNGSGVVAPNLVVAGIAIIPAEIRSWLSLNRDLLPEPPFTMVATAEVIGITSAGNDIRSNPIDYFVEIIPDNQFNQPAASGGATSSAEEEGIAIEESESGTGEFVDVPVE